jgi:ABC-type multidrug transport system fused ATPase/permease subunit
MDSIEALSRDLTILMIAHRLTTVERCDEIVVLEQGRVLATGTYAELVATNEVFRSLAATPVGGSSSSAEHGDQT